MIRDFTPALYLVQYDYIVGTKWWIVGNSMLSGRIGQEMVWRRPSCWFYRNSEIILNISGSVILRVGTY